MSYPDLNIELVGVNMAGFESGVSAMAEGRDLPLLQDTDSVDATTEWAAVYRDVVIVDADNRRVTAYNLTEHNLAEPANYAELRALLLDAAGE